MFKTFVSLLCGHASYVCFLLAQGGCSKWFWYECHICFVDFVTGKWKILKSQFTVGVTSLDVRQDGRRTYQCNIVCVHITIIALDKH